MKSLLSFAILLIVCGKSHAFAISDTLLRVCFTIHDGKTQQPLSGVLVMLSETVYKETNSTGFVELSIPITYRDSTYVVSKLGYKPLTVKLPSALDSPIPVLLYPDPEAPGTAAWANRPNDLPDTTLVKRKAIPIVFNVFEEKNREKYIKDAIITLGGHERSCFAVADSGWGELFVPLELADEFALFNAIGYKNEVYPILECVGDFPYLRVQMSPMPSQPETDSLYTTTETFFKKIDNWKILSNPFFSNFLIEKKCKDPKIECNDIYTLLKGSIYAPKGMSFINPDSTIGWQFQLNHITFNSIASIQSSDIQDVIQQWLQMSALLNPQSPLSASQRSKYTWQVVERTSYNYATAGETWGHVTKLAPIWLLTYASDSVWGNIWIDANGAILKQQESHRMGKMTIRCTSLNAPWDGFATPAYARIEIATPGAPIICYTITLQNLTHKVSEPMRGRLRDLDVCSPAIRQWRWEEANWLLR